jgi:hypothetical protein
MISAPSAVRANDQRCRRDVTGTDPDRAPADPDITTHDITTHDITTHEM